MSRQRVTFWMAGLAGATILLTSIDALAFRQPGLNKIREAAGQVAGQANEESAARSDPQPEKAIPPEKLAQESLKKAIDELSAEHVAFLKDPSRALRTECDYFSRNPNPDITPEMILNVLDRSLGGDIRTQAYVKWQLLSGVSGRFDDKLGRRAIAVYRRAPQPMARPGSTPSEQMQLNRATQAGGKEAERDAINKQMKEAVEKVHLSNQPILAYRNELYRRLPATLDAYLAGFEDAKQRLDLGHTADDHIRAVISDVRSWAIAGGPTPADLRRMAEVATKLKEIKGSEFFTEVKYKDNKLSWSKSKGEFNKDKRMEELAKFLEQQAANPTASGLKFKD